MQREDSMYDMNIDRQSSFQESSRSQPQQKSQQTALKIQIHQGLFCLFPQYLQKHNLSFGDCYQQAVRSSRQLAKISNKPEKIIKSDTGTLMKADLLQQKHIQQKDSYLIYSKDENGQIVKREINFNFQVKQKLKSIEGTIEKYREMNKQLIKQKKIQFEQRRQQQKRRLQQQMRQKQEWQRRIQQQQKQIAINRKKLKQEQQIRLSQLQVIRQMQALKQKARRQQQAILKELKRRQKQQEDRMRSAEYQQQQKIINWIKKNKLRQRYQNEPQQNISISDQQFEGYKREWYSKNKSSQFKRNQQRQIQCAIM